MVDAIKQVERWRACLVAVLASTFALTCCPERASADPAAAVRGTRMVVPALTLGLSHPRIIAAAAATRGFTAALTPLADPFADVTHRVSILYRDGLDLSGDEQSERLNLLVRSARSGGALCVRLRY